MQVRSCLLIVLIALGSTSLQAGKPAKLSPKDSPFAKVVDDPALPRVLLIGDSISIGYTVDVRAILAGKANVHRIPKNAGHTGMGLAGLPKWLDTKQGKWDVIHFNWGLWDLCYRNPQSKNQGRRDKVNGMLTHTPEQYAANLQKIVDQLKATKARLIFATTTPVPEGEAGRKVGDDLKYNAAAVEVMKRNQIQVNDLHAVMADKMAQYAAKPGDVHFKPAGSRILAEQVAAAIEEQLGKASSRSR